MTSAPNSELLTVVRDLSGARDLRRVTEIVRHAARRLTHADGVTFVLRDGDQCYYADEDAIAPLWKGRRFPAAACISGWVMQHRRSVAVRDIYQDERILQDAYRPTFVKSLVMVPVRAAEPIAAIGAYWAQEHQATAGEVLVLEALAEAASLAMANVQLSGELERSLAREQGARREAEAARRAVEDASGHAARTAAHPEWRIALSTMAGRLRQLRQRFSRRSTKTPTNSE
jgi:GAF domain-containing protein